MSIPEFPRAVWAAGLTALIVLAAGLCACTSLPLEAPAVAQSEPSSTSKAELSTWAQAMQAFEQGNYDEASSMFEVLSESAAASPMGRQARFAVVAIRLAQAQTPAEFNDALRLWQCWSQQMPAELAPEDPRMLTPFLQALTPPGVSEVSLARPQRSLRDVISTTNLKACRNTLEVREKEIERMRARLETREREVRELKHQIESLEQIHLKFQEKKQEVSSP